MINEESEKILKAVINTLGERTQVLMVLEEMSRLQEEILKNINHGKNNVDDIIEKIADVEIILEQLGYIYDIQKKVEDRILGKLKKMKSMVEG